MTVSISDIIDAPIERVWALVRGFRRADALASQVVRCTRGQRSRCHAHGAFQDWWAVESLTRLTRGSVGLRRYRLRPHAQHRREGHHRAHATDAQRTRIDWLPARRRQ
jgi:hypothetical protein